MGFVFHKMHGLGNDFAIFDCRNPKNQSFDPTKEQIHAYADRKLGIGFDQLILLKDISTYDVEMLIYNADGSKAAACGNAARCVGLLLNKESGSILCGERILYFTKFKDLVSVNMGSAVLGEKILINGRNYSIIDVGNQHAITWVEDLEQIDVARDGAMVANSSYFPDSINVTYAQKISNNHIEIRTWERGVGPTLACGSAACATAVFANGDILDKASSIYNITITQKGGEVTVRLVQNEVILTGPATYIYKGEIG